MKLEDILKQLEAEVYPLDDGWSHLNKKETAETIFNLQGIASIAIHGLYSALIFKPAELRDFFRSARTVPLIYSHSKGWQYGNKYFLENIEFGEDLVFKENVGTAHIGTVLCERLIRLINIYRILATNPGSDPMDFGFRDDYSFKNADQDLIQRVKELPSLPDSRNDWIWCMARLYFTCDHPFITTFFPNEIYENLKTYATERFLDKKARKEKNLRKTYPHGTKEADLAYDELDDYRRRKKELDDMVETEADEEYGLRIWLKKLLRSRLKS